MLCSSIFIYKKKHIHDQRTYLTVDWLVFGGKLILTEKTKEFYCYIEQVYNLLNWDNFILCNEMYCLWANLLNIV